MLPGRDRRSLLEPARPSLGGRYRVPRLKLRGPSTGFLLCHPGKERWSVAGSRCDVDRHGDRPGLGEYGCKESLNLAARPPASPSSTGEPRFRISAQEGAPCPRRFKPPRRRLSEAGRQQRLHPGIRVAEGGRATDAGLPGSPDALAVPRPARYPGTTGRPGGPRPAGGQRGPWRAASRRHRADGGGARPGSDRSFPRGRRDRRRNPHPPGFRHGRNRGSPGRPPLKG